MKVKKQINFFSQYNLTDGLGQFFCPALEFFASKSKIEITAPGGKHIFKAKACLFASGIITSFTGPEKFLQLAPGLL